MFNMESRHLLNLSVQNALDCISKNFNLKNFTGFGVTHGNLNSEPPAQKFTKFSQIR